MKIVIINTGSELFFDDICNTNLTFISRHLLKYGLMPSLQITVPDQLPETVRILKMALAENDTVIITGGLGSTSDDLTREAVSRATRQELVFNAHSASSLAFFFQRLNRPIDQSNLSQVYLPGQAEALPNRSGTAPGFWLKIPSPLRLRRTGQARKDKNIIALPGVPCELKIMFVEQVLPRLTVGFRPQRNTIKKIRVFGIPESNLAEQVAAILQPFNKELNTGFTVDSGGVITVRLSVRNTSGSRAANLLEKAENLLVKKLGVLIFGKDEHRLEDAAGILLLKKNLSVALAESCTGGLITHKLTNVPDISRSLKESIICYSNDSKIKRLRIPSHFIKKYGAVSREIAGLMARNAARLAKTDIGLGVTGLAGPSGGTVLKPVGLVYIALYFNGKITVKSYNFQGPREVIKERTANAALNLLRLSI
ncbi:MAG: CinA family nicotinamide mononucleotide deamidase-related protein [Planctomycetota bacterium]